MDYRLVLARCLNEPLNIEYSKLDILTSEVFIKMMVNSELIDRSQSTPESKVSSDLHIPNNTVIIPVHGSLVNKNGAGSSGITSYSSIRRQIISAIDEGAKNIVFDISSGGGESAGNFALTDLIHSLPSKYGITTYGFTDSTAASAAYAILSATQNTYAVDTATVGSIGTIMSLVDVTEADKKAGVSYKILRSKDNKATYNPHEKISAKVISDATTLLKVWDDKFNNIVNKYRPMLSLETITALDGKTVPALEGQKIGLVDNIVSSIEDVFAVINSGSASTKATKSVDAMSTTSSITTIGTNMALSLEEALNKVVDLQSKLDSEVASKQLDIKQAVAEDRTRGLKIFEARSAFGVSEKMALNAYAKGYSLDMVTEMFTEIKANQDASTVVNTTSPSPTGGVGSADQISIANIYALGASQAKTEDRVAGGALSMDDILKAMGDIGAEQLGGN